MVHRDKRTGQFAPSPSPNHDLFWSHVDKTGTHWYWTAGRTGAGYGAFYPVGSGGRQVRAHIWAWEEVNGPVPDGLVLDHLQPQCGIRHCVRPDHLDPTTLGDNVLRSPITQAGINARKTLCIRGHELSGVNLVVTPNCRNPALPPWRSCRTCRNDQKRERRRARRN